MRRALVLVVVMAAVAVAGCADGDDTVTLQQAVTEAAPAPEPAPTASVPKPAPTASVPEPGEPMPARCALEGIDAPGLSALSAEGLECEEAESVLASWLQDCGGKEGACEPVRGYTCLQERFAGSRSDVECAKGGAVVKFSFE
jgi:hypothetical protein